MLVLNFDVETYLRLVVCGDLWQAIHARCCCKSPQKCKYHCWVSEGPSVSHLFLLCGRCAHSGAISASLYIGIRLLLTRLFLRSLAACEQLYKAGYRNLFWLNGGLDAVQEGVCLSSLHFLIPS